MQPPLGFNCLKGQYELLAFSFLKALSQSLHGKERPGLLGIKQRHADQATQRVR